MRMAAAACAVLALPGCVVPRATGPAAPTSPTNDVKMSADGFMPDWVDGLTIVQDGSEDATCPWATAYPVVPGAAALTKALAEDVRARVKTARGGAGADRFACIEPANSTGLQIGFDFLIASADVIGVRLTNHDVAMDDFTNVQTYWYDGRTRKESTPVSLLSSAGLSSLCERIAQILAQRPGTDDEFARAALNENYREDTLSDLSFDSDGALHARFTVAEIQPVGVPAQEVVIPRAEVTPWLSDFGHRAQAQALHPEHRLTLGVTPGASDPTSPQPSEPEVAAGQMTPPVGPTVDCHAVKCIALTFDDGPGPYTARLLADLKQFNAHATFFVIGQHVVASPRLVRAEFAGGHEVGNHSWSHPELTRLTVAQVDRQLQLTDNAIHRATGQTPTLVRPPYGAVNAAVKRQIARPVILWNRDTLDWKVRNAQHVTDAVLGSARPGDIVLMHDIHPTTVDAVPGILQALTEQGYHFVTVSQLLQGVRLNPGQAYSGNPGSADPAAAP
jgi:peptidoglycan/xylan/chitin deacetylase (PgdA/CDA1 family)